MVDFVVVAVAGFVESSSSSVVVVSASVVHLAVAVGGVVAGEAVALAALAAAWLQHVPGGSKAHGRSPWALQRML